MIKQDQAKLPPVKGISQTTKLLSPFTWTHLKLPQIDLSRLQLKKIKEETKTKTQQGKFTKQKERNKNKKPEKSNEKPSTSKNKKSIQSKATSGSKRKKKIKSKEKQMNSKSIDFEAKEKKFFKHNQTIDLGKKRQKRQTSAKETFAKHNQTIDLGKKREKKQTHVKESFPKHNKTIDFEKKRQKRQAYFKERLQKILTREQNNKNIIKLNRQRSPKPQIPVESKCISYNKMQPFILRAFAKEAWIETKGISSLSVPEVVWTDNFYTHELVPGQLHNHIRNGHLLTSKNHLHQCQSAFGSIHYPQSFLLPQEYDNFCLENQQNFVKIGLKLLLKEAAKLLNFQTEIQTCLGAILPSLVELELNKQSMMCLRMCFYLQNYRKNRNYKFFENFSSFVDVEINLKPQMKSTVVQWCFNDVKNEKTSIEAEKVEKPLLQLLWLYHILLTKYESSYLQNGNRNLWIVKPMASSRGAGIFLLPNSLEFTTLHKNMQYTNKSKFMNKIIQKYIEEPFLLSEPEAFAGRKFDIRQWVLLTNVNSQPLIYVYDEAYCRFSDSIFTYDYKRKDQSRIHLTNYSKSQKANKQISVMMLEEAFPIIGENSKQNYQNQLKKIIIQSILNTPQIIFQPGHFELLGYDLLLDHEQHLWLLQINLNPACESTRQKKLQVQATQMVIDMIKIVKSINGKNQQLQSSKWNLIHGKEPKSKTLISQISADVKPFYDIEIDKDSFLEEVRKRNKIATLIQKTSSLINLREPWNALKEYNLPQEEVKKEQKQGKDQDKKQEKKQEKNKPEVEGQKEQTEK